MKRQYKSPNYLARSTAWGMGLAFAPFPGQIPLVTALWLVARKSKWRFSLPISIAWTFISNVFTNLPLFYMYYITGDWIINQQSPMAYSELKAIFNDGIIDNLAYVLTKLGYGIIIGSIVYMLTFATIGYLLGYGIARYHQKSS